MTDDGFGNALIALYAYWPKEPELSEGHENAWREMLDPLPDEAVQAAVLALCRDGRTFRPVVGEVYAKASELADDTPTWGEAWKELRDACDAFDPREVVWSHPVVGEAARQIGLREIGFAERGDTAFEAQCRGVYEAIRDGHRKGVRYAGISGIDQRGRLAGPQALGALLGPSVGSGATALAIEPPTPIDQPSRGN